MLPGVVHQDLAQDVAGDGEEMGAAVPAFLFVLDELEIGLVNQDGRLARAGVAFAGELGGGELAELPVDDRREVLERGFVAAAPPGAGE